ncbi:hypothetical protein [Cyclobacterium sp.]|uniref:hypothetical protein n=1 Tax=Cyclobacterium sp. TaxID=1966343 RepID=UPI00198396AE|nr:hypothetical protein [Cyclobacterium sp.]MBD3627854.1 hypothetical protein [Cyclobacterium sp.]
MNILFITWDSDQTNYLENLFFPIFKGIQARRNWQFHVMQFSWADAGEVERIRTVAKDMGIVYQHVFVHRKPTVTLGVLRTIILGKRNIKRYVQNQPITCLMPRSTLPAMMVNQLRGWLKGIQLVFDADGLPIQERVDFAGLKPGSLQYRWLKRAETKMLIHADKVLTRTEKAIQFHLRSNPVLSPSKFYKVSNGRDSGFFKPNPAKRARIRRELGIKDNSLLWIYSGSLGPPYQLEEMLRLFWSHYQFDADSRILFLVRNHHTLSAQIPDYLRGLVWIKTVPFTCIPDYYAAGDLGLSLRKSAPSLTGLAPIKVGEYLLSGLPVIVSEEIGDLSIDLEGEPACFMYSGNDAALHSWLETLAIQSKSAIRKVGTHYFGLDKSVAAYVKALEAK